MATDEPTDLRAFLARHGLTAKKSLGQNFLEDEAVLERIVDLVARHRPTAIVEIGPGLGSLTAALATLERPLVAVERDRALVPLAQARVAASPWVQLVEADALETRFADLLPGHERPVVAGNLPYSISSALLLHCLAQRAELGPAVFMLQREVADRLAAPPGSRDYGSLSALFALVADVDVAFDVSPQAFFPVPKVWSSVLHIRWRAEPRAAVSSVADFETVTRAAFSQRRKTLRNALTARFGRDVAAAALEAAGIAAERRAETLSVEELAGLTRSFEGLGALVSARAVDDPAAGEVVG